MDLFVLFILEDARDYVSGGNIIYYYYFYVRSARQLLQLLVVYEIEGDGGRSGSSIDRPAKELIFVFHTEA